MKRIGFKTAKLIKEKGLSLNSDTSYDENGVVLSFSYIHNHPNCSDCYPRPTQSEIQKWLRNIYDIHIVPIIDPHSQVGLYGYKIYGYDTNEFRCLKTSNLHLSYEDAMELGLLYGLKLI